MKKPLIHAAFLVVFFITFPVVFVSCISSPSESALTKDTPSLVPVLDERFASRGKGAALRIASHPSLDPAIDSQWAMMMVFRVPSEPQPGRRQIFAVKYERENSASRGYAFALSADREGHVYPEVYWRGNALVGGWHRLTPFMHAIQEKWMVIILAKTEGRFAGVFSRPLHSSQPFQLHGGFQFVENNPVITDEPLFLGSPYGGDYRGNFAMLAFLQGNMTSQKAMREVTTALLQKPSSLGLPKVKVNFLTYDGRADLGPHQIPIDDKSMFFRTGVPKEKRED